MKQDDINEIKELSQKAIDLQSENYMEECIAEPDFYINDAKESCVLIMGLNPAGNEEDAKREKDYPFLCLDDDVALENLKKYVYKKYFYPIKELVENTTSRKTRWSWCDMSEEEIKNKYKALGKEELREILDYYKNHIGDLTIINGDMVYYHETNSKKLPIVEKEFNNHCKVMLEKHIELIKKYNKSIMFVYINNAFVSHALCDAYNKKDVTFIDVDGVKVFLGSMLSGQRAMDTFSRSRLVSEIKEYLNQNN